MPFLSATSQFGNRRKRERLAPSWHFTYTISVPKIRHNQLRRQSDILSYCSPCLKCKQFFSTSQTNIYQVYGHNIGEMPWRSKSLAFPPVSELASWRDEGHPGNKNSAPTPRLWCDVFRLGLVQASETANINIAGPIASLCHCVCCMSVLYRSQVWPALAWTNRR